ncbi:MAG: hypothetical protein M3P22_00885, partial [bacterium]|nr:hypothetical protein [bacterium]
NSTVALRTEGELILNYRLIGPGGIQVFRDNNLPVNATVYDVSGKALKKVILGGDEDFFWISEYSPSQMYLLKLDGYKTVKFLKFRRY